MTYPNWPSVEFWKLPLSANPGMTQCQPFDFYQPTDYSGYTDDRLTERRTLGFGGAVVAISGRARGTGVSPS